ncbi:Protein YIPF6 [Smittium culicis]|uniref:Protein YIP n=1 Tax=Smittium culicis TaxID=133412 RepID=A0A1R1XWP3_9FUNG|nr:Protein YIPF6 [Smittium culicis]
MNQYNQDFISLEPDSPHLDSNAEPTIPNLSGRLNTPLSSSNYHNSSSAVDSLPGGFSRNTLDESVMDSILRDFYEVAGKTKQVLIPKNKKNVLKEYQQAAIVFTEVFMVMSLGSCVITLNCKLLGGQISFFQSVCALGYCVFPLVFSTLLMAILKKNIFTVLFVLVTVAWSIYAASGFLTDAHFASKKFLALYPIILFYSTIGWIITM